MGTDFIGSTGDDMGYCMFSIALAMPGQNINSFARQKLDAAPA